MLLASRKTLDSIILGLATTTSTETTTIIASATTDILETAEDVLWEVILHAYYTSRKVEMH